MLPSAFGSLSNPCLPDFWIITYSAAPGAISMAAVFGIFLVEFGATRYLAAHRMRDETLPVIEHANSNEHPEKGGKGSVDAHGHHHYYPPVTDVEPGAATTQKLGVAILEAGIIFHSVFIGLTLAVSTGSDFVSLFITIIFHRIPPP